MLRLPSTQLLLVAVPLVTAVLVLIADPHPTQPSDPTATFGKARAAFAGLPLSFEANHGQCAEQVKFLTRGPGYTLFLTPQETVLSSRARNAEGERAVIRMRLVGAKPAPEVTGQNQLPGKISYFTGNDPSKWQTGISTFGKVRYDDVYPGISVVYYGKGSQLEYDFIVSPGADPGVIQLEFEGHEGLRIDANGSLVLHTSDGELVQPRPVVYQGEGEETELIACSYVQSGKGAVGFRIAQYDLSRPLIIDPKLLYSTFLGGSGGDGAVAIAVDKAGSMYVTGMTDSDFPLKNPFQQKLGGSRDVFVAKFDPSGSILLYSTYLGGGSFENVEGIEVDAAGHAYIAGQTASANFPVKNAFQSTIGGSNDVFVTKLSPSGSSLVYSTFLGGGSFDLGRNIALDRSGNAYVTGRTASNDFPLKNPLQKTRGDTVYQDAFLAKLNASGSALIYSTFLGGNQQDIAEDVAVDILGNAYVVGHTFSTNFPLQRPSQGTYGGARDAFVTKINAAGSALIYSTYLGGSASDLAEAIALDTAGNVYVTGSTDSNNFPVKNPFQGTIGGQRDAFVTKFNSSGSRLYSTYFGGANWDEGRGITVGSAGNAYITGNTTSSNLPTTRDAYDGTHNGNIDAFVSRLDPSKTGATQLVHSTFLGGSDYDCAFALSVDPSGVATVTGQTLSTDFPTTSGAYDTTHNGNSDVFVSRLRMAVALYGHVHEISISAGGTQKLSLDAGKSHANRLYWIFGSVTGTTPGVTLGSAVGPVHIPLNPDIWTGYTITLANTAALTNTRAALDASGTAQASFNIPKVNLPSAIGLVFHHAYLVYDRNSSFYMASNPVPLGLTK